MRAYLKAILISLTALGIGGVVHAQSSNPFSGLFGDEDSDSPVSLDFRVAGDNDRIERMIKGTSLLSSALAEDRITGQDLLAAARADYARILGALYDEGHYSAVIDIKLDGVEAAEIAPLDAPELVRSVVVIVDPGPEFAFSRAAIGPLAPGAQPSNDYRRGEPAGTGVIKSEALSAVASWREYGHAKADVSSQEIVADHNSNTVDSQIGLESGPVVTFGELHISGYSRMNPRRLRKIAGFPTGQRFDPEDLETMRKRLRRTGVFSATTIEEAEQLGPNNSMDVSLAVVEQKPHRIGAGFELSNTDGAMVSAYWMHRNILGGGERLRIDGKISDMGSDVSGRDEELKFRLDRPATITPDTTAYTETKLERMREEEYDSDNLTIGVGFNHIFSDELTADIAIEYETSRVTDANGETDFRVLALPMEATWDMRDEPNNAKRGFYLSAEVTPFKGFEETGSGVRALGEARGFYSLGEDDKFTLAGRAKIGTVAGTEIERTPRDYLFYSGGGGTVRGQPYESLGVREIPGPDERIKTGGMSTAVLNAELRWQFGENLGVVFFADYGKVWAESGFGGNNDWHSGAGAGIRYNTPIGPLRFDIAGPVGGDTGDGVQLYLGLGQAF
ncbi:autotransporter assembly complex protein TamA [Paracoccus onubensis]|uniref:Outer membrane protein assembly factor n=1 Tax=Paracoccus onubensis TaxID=1675788 RepID=A0A418SRD2_9RHOB|nr:autotransporter assembly complex family protein [Paracoccus onubensis]RJE83535.1 outer membrane protein assembly factor [Paracoccus onubensis]